MPTNVADSAQQIQSGPGASGGDALATMSGILSDIQLARELIAGRQEPHPMFSSKQVDEALERLLPGRVPPLRIRNAFNLQFHYGGRTVACFESPSGVVAVLAVGVEKIAKLLKSLTPDEVDRIVIHYPMPLPACETGEEVVTV